MDTVHTPALLKEVIEYLNPKPGDQIIDATLDGGGHTLALLQKFTDIKILGIEWDSQLFEEAVKKFKSLKVEDRLVLVNDNYTNIGNVVREYNFRPNGILFDLGLSSWHYEKSGRGFSFRRDEPLDMRYNAYQEVKSKNEKVKTAAEIINTYNEENLERIFREYGEEKFSKQIADQIIKSRKSKPILKTSELVEVINRSVPVWYKKRKIHFATKTFQALRIEVNAELRNVEEGVIAAINVLKPACPEQGRRGGRLAVISFHGVEDKIVREIFKKKVKEGTVKWAVKGTVRPEWEEIKNNPRARSAKMKIVEKI